MRDASSAALEFGYQVLGWEDAIAFDREIQDDTVIELRRSSGDDGEESEDATVILRLIEFSEDCWIVTNVQQTPEREKRYQEHQGASLSVQGRQVQGYFADFKDSATAVLEIGYGGDTSRGTWSRGDDFVQFRLDFDPGGKGHFLVLLRDAGGEVFSAFGSPLPEGDFAAG